MPRRQAGGCNPPSPLIRSSGSLCPFPFYFDSVVNSPFIFFLETEFISTQFIFYIQTWPHGDSFNLQFLIRQRPRTFRLEARKLSGPLRSEELAIPAFSPAKTATPVFQHRPPPKERPPPKLLLIHQRPSAFSPAKTATPVFQHRPPPKEGPSPSCF
jgi:hypothetical protein